MSSYRMPIAAGAARCQLLALVIVLAGVDSAAAARLTVCAEDSAPHSCRYVGGAGMQRAVDDAGPGDTIMVRAGVYAPGAPREVRYKKYEIPGAVVIVNKTVMIEGEEGAVLDGAHGPATSGIVVEGGHVSIHNMHLRGFRAASSTDDIYDGHGLFLIDADVAVSDVTLENIEKMALTARGASTVRADRLLIQSGHVGIWLEESASLRLNDSVVRNNESAGICAYGHASAKIYNSVFDGNHDDGIYGDGHAVLRVTDSLVLRNVPFGVRGTKSSSVWIGYSVLFANQHAISHGRGENRVTRGHGLIEADPEVDAQYRARAGSPLDAGGDPSQLDERGAALPIGLTPAMSGRTVAGPR